ncbi:hypothetical protein IL45_04725 [Nonlabens ulvanivorans]|uniref:RNA-directed DNA polymerase n=1 Tax=Nonlabens ulvanivorans TaxID=906888 RepID=A0A084JX36_NONUL|nr:reverse transcriptase family protein [Nonlabens ulvanivorans]KEZ93520.1 hypothetical protein IL45_04725 [Nonlabens ulvanivorans]
MKNFESYKSEFTKRAYNEGFSSDEISKCLNYSETLLKKNLPIIFNSSHLSALVGYNKDYLNRVSKVNKTSYFYRDYYIPKKNGEKRLIREPLPSLKQIQRWLLDNLFIKLPISPYAKAYRAKKGIRDHVRYHKKEEVVITMDIEKFFDNLESGLIVNILLSKGYSFQVANLITKICTLNDVLPQGAPTSPAISNILLYEFDNEISKYTNSKGLKYTRYADDLAFSGSIQDVDTLIKIVKENLAKINLKINHSKTRVMSKKARQIISGIVVNDKIQVPRKDRDDLRQAMYYIEKFSLEEHLKKIDCNKANYIEHLLGKANYMLKINPKDEKIKVIYNKLKVMKTG